MLSVMSAAITDRISVITGDLMQQQVDKTMNAANMTAGILTTRVSLMSPGALPLATQGDR